MEQAKVNTEHPAYALNKPVRERFEGVIGGTHALRRGGKQFLSMFEAESKAAYDLRTGLSLIRGQLAGGIVSMSGKVFHDEPDVSKVNPSIVPFLENIDNKGNHFNVFARDAFEKAFCGCSVILVDAPKAEGEIRSEGDARRQGLRPYWRIYEAKDVINWRTIVDPITKKERYSLMVLHEGTIEEDGDFGHRNVDRYRVYRHEPMAQVTVEVWIKSRDKEDFVIEQGPFTLPKFTAIPIAVIGELGGEPWLMDEAENELLIYFKRGVFNINERMAVPMIWTKGYPEDGPNLAVSAETHIKLPADQHADIGVLQIDADGYTSLKATIAELENNLSAQLDYITDSAMSQGGDVTATEVASDDSKSQARLIVWSQQLKDALERALQFTAESLGMKDDKGGEITLRTAWIVAQEKAKEAEEFDRTIITEELAAKTAK